MDSIPKLTPLPLRCRYSSIQNSHLTEAVRSEIAVTQQALQKAVTITDDQMLRLTGMSKTLENESGIDTRIDGAIYAELVRRLDEERKAAVATKGMLNELLSRFQGENAGQANLTSQGHSVHATFGANNLGLQSGVIHGGVYSAHFGSK